MSEPRLWIEHGYMDIETVDDFDLAQMVRVSLPGWSNDRPNTAILHVGPPESGISVLGTVSQLRRLLDGARATLRSTATDDHPSSP